MNKNRHKYPNRDRVIKKRLVLQAVLLLLLVGAVFFYFYIHSDDNAGAPAANGGEAAREQADKKNQDQRKAGSRERPEKSGPDKSGQGKAPDKTGPGKPDQAVSGQQSSEASPGRARPEAAAGRALEGAAVQIATARGAALPAASPAPGQAAGQVSGQAPSQTSSQTPGQVSGQISGQTPAPAQDPTPREAAPADSALPNPGPVPSGRPGLSLAGKTLDQAAASLASAYAGQSPTLWGEKMPGITSKLPVAFAADDAEQPAAAPRVVALTLDACGGKKGASYDKELIAFLREKRIPATIFVTSIWLRNNREILKELAADPLFEIAAHGSEHKPCSVIGKSVYKIKGTASFAELVREVEGNARDISAATGRRPRWFRSGTAYYDDIAVKAIHDLGLSVAGYSISGDEGATLSADKVAERVLKARHGDILLLHMNRPKSGTRDGLKRALPKLLEDGCVFVRLSSLR